MAERARYARNAVPDLMPASLRLSVIIPALNEVRGISAAVASAQRHGAEVIVADGGSRDGTQVRAQSMGAILVDAVRGRGPQMNAGAEHATGDVLLFLHADTVLPPDAGCRVQELFRSPAVEAATFRLRFRERHPLLGIYELCGRLESPLTRFGDACIVVRTRVFREVGGYPPWEILEDVEFLRRLRRRTRVHTLPAAVETSARRFLSDGILGRQAANAAILLLFLSGVKPERLASLYRNRGDEDPDVIPGV